MKKTKNEVLQFLAGLVMLIVGLYIFSQKVIVSSAFFGGRLMLGGFHVSNGLIMIPFIAGIVWMFASGGSPASKATTAIGVLIIIVTIILSTNISLARITLYEWVIILVLIFGGAGLLARNLFAIPGLGKGRRKREMDMEDLAEKKLWESRQQLRDIQEEIEKLKKDK